MARQLGVDGPRSIIAWNGRLTRDRAHGDKFENARFSDSIAESVPESIPYRHLADRRRSGLNVCELSCTLLPGRMLLFSCYKAVHTTHFERKLPEREPERKAGRERRARRVRTGRITRSAD